MKQNPNVVMTSESICKDLSIFNQFVEEQPGRPNKKLISLRGKCKLSIHLSKSSADPVK